MPAPKYKKEYCKLLIDLFKKGKSVCHFCAKLEIGRQTFYDWLETQKEFAEAYDRAKEANEAWFTDLGVSGASGEIDGFNQTAWSILMRNKHNYTEHRKIKIDFTNCKTATEMQKALNEQSAKCKLTAAELKNLSEYINNCMKIEENTELRKRIEELESNA
jgi:hypothetical protein